MRDAAENDPRLLDVAAVELDRGGDGDQRERIRRAIAHL
jgi:hypothetical protein